MATELIWDVVNLERNSLNGGVITAHWTLTAADEVLSTNVYGSVGFVPNPDSPDFIPFDELNKDIVVSWVKNALGDEQVEIYENGVVGQIESLKNPVTESGLPWLNTNSNIDIVEPIEDPEI
jgi:hypothetical protein